MAKQEILTYEQFKTETEKNLVKYLDKEHRDIPLKIDTVEKTNRILDGIRFDNSKGTGNRSVSPVIYINDMYMDYLMYGHVVPVLDYYGELMSRSLRDAPDVIKIPNFDDMKDNIVFRLINTEQNIKMLENIPHREYLDLSIIYVYTQSGEEVNQSMKINNRMAEWLSLTEDDLFRLATENTKRILPPVSTSLVNMVREYMKENGMSEEFADITVDDMPQLYVISNAYNSYGAAAMLYEDILFETAKKTGGDIYIMPSSTHEVIAVSASVGEPDELAKMVAEINMEQVKLEERLSNQVYHYDKELRKVTLATDTPYKRLDEDNYNKELQQEPEPQRERKTIRG